MKYFTLIITIIFNIKVFAQDIKLCSLEDKVRSINFLYNSYKLNTKSKLKLDTIASDLIQNSNCYATIIFSANGNHKENLLHWKRVKSCIEYLTLVKRIHNNRFCFQTATCIQGAEFRFSEKDDNIYYGAFPPKPLKNKL